MGNKHSNVKKQKDEDDKSFDMSSLKAIIYEQDNIPVFLNSNKLNLLIYGYIREWNNDNVSNDSMTIPQDLLKTFILFYPINEIKFNSTKYGSALKFEKEHKIVGISTSLFAYPTAILNTIITDEICNRFEIEYVVKHTCQFLAGFGYIPLESWQYYNIHNGFGRQMLRGGTGKDYSKGMYVGQGCEYLAVSYRGHWYKERLNYKPLKKFRSGDIIKLVYDFDKDEFCMYYKDIFVDKTSLEGEKSIIPGVCLSFDYITLEIYDYTFH